MNYKISWTQPYTEFIDYAERMLELQVEYSNLKEANQVIDYIKQLK
jgi:hypothetical protein